MTSGRMPGDFWPRAPNYVPPGALSESEMDDQHACDSDVDLAHLLETPPKDAEGSESENEEPMKRPGAKLKEPVMKRPSALRNGKPTKNKDIEDKDKANTPKTVKARKANAKPFAKALAKAKAKAEPKAPAMAEPKAFQG